MRETTPIFIVLKGDKQRAQQYVGVARTLVGRMKSYLGGSDGAKTWVLGNGVSIRTLAAGDVTKVTIEATAEEAAEKGYYFVYLFGALTDESAKAYGWKIDRGTDQVSAIEGMPQTLFTDPENPTTSTITPPTGGRVRCSADSYQHESEIVVLIKVHSAAVVDTDGIVATYIMVFKADEDSGRLIRKSCYSVPDVSSLNGPSAQSNLYATQVRGTYLINNDVNVIAEDADANGPFGPYSPENQSYLFTSGSSTIPIVNSEQNWDGSLTIDNSYVINRIGMSQKHPKEKVFYTAFMRYTMSDDLIGDPDSAYHRYKLFIRAYEYGDPSDAPTLVTEWSMYHRTVDLFAPPHAPLSWCVVGDGRELVINHGRGSFTCHPLSSDGRAFTSHWKWRPVSGGYAFNEMLDTDPYFQMTSFIFPSNLIESCLMEMRVSEPDASVVVTDYGSSGKVGTYPNSADGSLDYNGAVYTIERYADSPDHATAPSGLEQNPPPGDTYHSNVWRRAHSFARLINGKRAFCSVGRSAVNASGTATYSDVPRLCMSAFVRHVGYFDVDIVDLANVVLCAGDDPRLDDMVRTDRLSGIAIFEPLAGR